jgi:hypothetical protein
MMICNIPMQPIDSSYSKQWHEWIQAELNTRDLEHETLLPSVLVPDYGKGYIDTTSVVDFRATQLQTICQLIHNRTLSPQKRIVFFFHNAWFPIDQLAFLRDMFGAHDWKFVGCFRDGTYDKWDMSARNNMYTWGEDIENGWLKIYDAIVVGSKYHKDTIVENRRVRENKIHVIPWHVEVPLMGKITKQNIVVWPHRLDPEKQPEVFSRLASDCEKDGWRFERTRDMKLNKNSYQNYLAKCKIVVSTALLEMFGNAMVEATLLGCTPLVPDRLAYRDNFRQTYRYSDYSDMVEKLKWFMSDNFKHEIAGTQLKSSLYEHITERYFFTELFDLLEEV